MHISASSADANVCCSSARIHHQPDEHGVFHTPPKLGTVVRDRAGRPKLGDLGYRAEELLLGYRVHTTTDQRQERVETAGVPGVRGLYAQPSLPSQLSSV